MERVCSCGVPRATPEARFCVSCGKPLLQPCPRCNHWLDLEGAFKERSRCDNCGVRLTVCDHTCQRLFQLGDPFCPCRRSRPLTIFNEAWIGETGSLVGHKSGKIEGVPKATAPTSYRGAGMFVSTQNHFRGCRGDDELTWVCTDSCVFRVSKGSFTKHAIDILPGSEVVAIDGEIHVFDLEEGIWTYLPYGGGLAREKAVDIVGFGLSDTGLFAIDSLGSIRNYEGSPINVRLGGFKGGADCQVSSSNSGALIVQGSIVWLFSKNQASTVSVVWRESWSAPFELGGKWRVWEVSSGAQKLLTIYGATALVQSHEIPCTSPWRACTSDGRAYVKPEATGGNLSCVHVESGRVEALTGVRSATNLTWDFVAVETPAGTRLLTVGRDTGQLKALMQNPETGASDTFNLGDLDTARVVDARWCVTRNNLYLALFTEDSWTLLEYSCS